MKPEHVISTEEVVYQYAPGRGVCGVSLAVSAGDCYAILGCNGSGKTTLIRLLLGLQRPTSGRVSVLSCSVGKGSRDHLGRCGAALDTSAHWQHLSGRQNATLVARLYGLTAPDADSRVGELLELADLNDHADDAVAAAA